MLPFVRTARELEACRRMFDEAGLLDRRGFELWVMAEVPSVLFNLERYAALGDRRDLDRLQRPHPARARRPTATPRCWRRPSTSATPPWSPISAS